MSAALLRSSTHRLVKVAISRPTSRRLISTGEILKRSPYEELKVDFDITSTKDNPIKINAYGTERTVACVCDDVNFMTLKEGPPIECACGHWFQLVKAEKFWEK